MARRRLGIDVGGTFTDFVMVEDDARILIHKRLSTPEDPSVGVVAGVREMAERYGFDVRDIDRIVHGTTVVANALIERKGARTGLVATAGFGDVLEIGREVRYDIYDLAIAYPPPLAPRDLRREVDERTLADGTVRTRPDPVAVRRIGAELRDAGVRSLAVCLLHAHRNPENERAVAAALREAVPDVRVTLSSDIAPEIREFERTATTVANAYVLPLVDGYLERLERTLREIGFGGTLMVMLSHGGIVTVGEARARPVELVESGPAAGAEASCFVGRLSGDADLLAFDMGGTTAKATVIDDGAPSYTTDTEVARIHRFKKGSGLPLKIPSVEMIEIGAGGGSIARIDAMGLVKVGPESAGADPGPACYGQGGTEPTVTDADLLLGYLDPANFLGGAMRLDAARADRAIAARIAGPLGTDVLRAAAGIVAIANENMASAARLHVAERGRDIRRYTLVAFGGAGPVHAYGVARALRLRRVLYPVAAGVLSALGFLVAPAAQRLVRSDVAVIDQIDWTRLRGLIAEMRASATAALAEAGVGPGAETVRLTADLQYAGQGYTIEVPVPLAVIDVGDAAALREAFEARYRAVFGTTLPGLPVEALNWRLAAQGPAGTAPLGAARPAGGEDATPARTGQRAIWIPERQAFATAAIYDRYRLAPGMRFAGPAVVEERESTVVINGAGTVDVDARGNLVVTMP
jgi:N-methylhydantoinase A